LGAFHLRRVVEAVMDSDGPTGKYWTAFLRVVAHGQDVIEFLASEFVNAFGSMAGNVDAQFFHGRDGFGPDVARFRARAFDFEAVARVVSQQAFGHLAARGISRA
jgi:hypothetical protein